MPAMALENWGPARGPPPKDLGHHSSKRIGGLFSIETWPRNGKEGRSLTSLWSNYK